MRYRQIKTLIGWLIVAVLIAATAAFVPNPAKNSVTEALAQSPCGMKYTVQQGDYLAKISDKCDVSIAVLARSNPHIEDLDLIFPGETLLLPGAIIQGSQGEPEIYIVESGDTLGEIADRFNTNVATLLDSNPEIDDPSAILAGQRLGLPTTLIPDTGARAGLDISPEVGPPGTRVTVEGVGFPANSIVTVGPGVLGSEPVTAIEADTGSDRRFEAVVTVPTTAEVGETWVIAAITEAGEGVSARAEFQVTSVTPDHVYIVRRGDTFFEIASRLDITLATLLRANPDITDPSLILPGQEILLPGAFTVDPDTNERFYVAQESDTLSEIADRFGTTVADLMGANPEIEEIGLILPGQHITIPLPVVIIPDTGQVVYVVQPGDTLSEIADLFDVSLSTLLRTNEDIADPSVIFPEQRIVIPTSGG